MWSSGKRQSANGKGQKAKNILENDFLDRENAYLLFRKIKKFFYKIQNFEKLFKNRKIHQNKKFVKNRKNVKIEKFFKI